MQADLTRRWFVAVFLAGATSPFALVCARADTLPAPTGKPILTISGAISVANRPDGAAFDRNMLEALAWEQITTTTPWHSGRVRFEGVPLELLMRVVGATGSSVTAYSLNDFTTSIPVSDFKRFHPILALKKDGEYMPVRDKGPLFIVYPYDSNPELQQQAYYNRSAWQVARLVVG